MAQSGDQNDNSNEQYLNVGEVTEAEEEQPIEEHTADESTSKIANASNSSENGNCATESFLQSKEVETPKFTSY